MKKEQDDLFFKLKDQLLNIDPVYFCQKYLTLDGKPFKLEGNGYKPFADIYRYIAIKALEPNSKPIIMVKGRQVGATTMASALEMYFMGCGLFGVDNKPPIRIIHTFPQLELAAAYSKTKLSQIINTSIPTGEVKPGVKQKSYMQSLLDTSSSTNDSLHFKQFIHGNHLWIESTGLDADRLIGRTADVMFIDECFTSNQMIETIDGKSTIGTIYRDFKFKNKKHTVKTFNEKTGEFEYKQVSNAWCHGKRKIITINISTRKIKCTPNHKFLTENGWEEANNIKPGTLIKSTIKTNKVLKSLTDDQYQVLLGSFLGDGHVQPMKNLSRFRLSFTHGEKQKEYCEWKAKIFNSKVTEIEKNGYALKKAFVFRTKLFGLNKTFPKTKTSCPQWILDDLDARGLAIWFMDDGSKLKSWDHNKSSSGIISTCSFDEDSQIRIVKKLQDFGIKSYYKKYDDYYYIVLNKDAFQKLKEIISPYMHESLFYKLNLKKIESKYNWSYGYKNHGWLVFDKKEDKNQEEYVYDIEVEDNHNFILCGINKGKIGGPIAHNCQKTTDHAIGNALKILTTAKYGNKGVQVLFGTPRKKGSGFYKRWMSSTQQYYYLGCEKCKKHFPLYTPGSDEWEKIWLYGFIVKCTHCGHEQDKRTAAENGKWVPLKQESDEDCRMIGFHINQLYMPTFTKEDILNEKPGIHPVNTERIYQNEVLGEFFQGDSSPITPEEIRESCAEIGRKFRSRIAPGEEQIVVLGIDYGARADLEQLANPDKVKGVGQSYSTAVVLSVKGSGLLSIEFATKFKRNDFESKKGIIDQLMRQYSVDLAIGDIGYSNDFSEVMHTTYGDRYLVSRAHNRVNNYVKFNQDAYPKELVFERDHYISEIYEQMKKGMIKFPFGDYEKIAWLIEHCASMEIKPSISRGGDPSVHYVKGSTPNDGFMALLNAYIAYKFIITKGFTNNNPAMKDRIIKDKNKPLVVGGYIRKRF